MLRKLLLLSLLSLTAFASSAFAQSAAANDGRDADRAAIRAHIESICQAFIDGDIEKIYATHTEDWRGFLENSRVPIKGIDEYMKYYGFTWPRPANAPKPAPNPNAATTGFKVFDFDVHFYGPELAVVNFMVDFGRKSGSDLVTMNRYRIMDVYAKRKGHWIQAASHTVVDPTWRWTQITSPGTLSEPARKQLLDAREAVWRAWFTNDQAKLEQLIPEDVITIDNGSDAWGNRASVLEGAKRFAESGAKLVRLEFPRTEMQVYGRTVIIYTTYVYELERNGQTSARSGRATEIFVLRDGKWVNPGWHLDSGK
jgi:ketosteroid isomerase-like protein